MTDTITCRTCGRENVPNWDGEGHCITCTRDIALGKDQDAPDEAIVSAIKLLEANGYEIQLKLPEVDDA